MQLIKRYIRIKEGISVFKTHLDFNRTCKERKVVPQSLRLKRPVSTPEGMDIITKAEHRLVNASPPRMQRRHQGERTGLVLCQAPTGAPHPRTDGLRRRIC
ncbi:hypothetical protein HPB48_004514 [Haemaphysalis longicornis]|uniref:Uncharacterized protein n=1 Tax=Haemaphysalis longicornis TaxID=44386 RepID=A0A9J6FYM9_HAELO|nr:hypothetical protein HPB48_004514 [Haemaphysalis longicornis]